MYKNILVATDGSELSTKALNDGFGLAKQSEAKVTVVTVTERWPAVEIAAQAEMGIKDPIGHFERVAEKSAAAVLDKAEDISKKIGVSLTKVHVKDRNPAEGIVETAEKIGADLIVISSHGRRGLRRLLLGSVANEVLVHSSVPVLVCR